MGKPGWASGPRGIREPAAVGRAGIGGGPGRRSEAGVLTRPEALFPYILFLVKPGVLFFLMEKTAWADCSRSLGGDRGRGDAARALVLAGDSFLIATLPLLPSPQRLGELQDR